MCHIYLKHSDTGLYCICPKIGKTPFYYLLRCLKTAGVTNSVNPDQADLDLHSLLTHVCPNNYGEHGVFFLAFSAGKKPPKNRYFI